MIRMNVKLVSFIFMLTVVLLQSNTKGAKVNLWRDFKFLLEPLYNYLFPKDPVVRVRKPEDVKTEQNNVTLLNFIGLVEKHGYSAEEYYVTTKDGYNLVIHRISERPLSKTQQRRKVVFFQHGLLVSSDTWVLLGPGRDLAFLLVDQGYDVWLGNYRGSSYCKSHVKISSQNKDFWQFSYHEMGTRDLPAMIDYVLNYTKQKTLRYIGHSMGTTMFFILLSMKPEYNAKIELGICLAPIAIWKEPYPLNVFKYIGNEDIKEFFDFNKIYELYSTSSRIIKMGRTLCADKTITQALCVAIISLISGFNSAQFNATLLPEILSYFPSGCSMQTLHHYYQNLITEKFQAYDYGYLDNYKQYGQIRPITYDLKKITTPLALFYSGNDFFTSKPSVLETYRHLPNVIVLEEISYKLFNHLDFLYAIDVKTLLYDRLIQLLRKFNYN
ncbi:PREDICTED: lipase 3-like isoform X2 [Wasmannia auropunctata]|uniref:lipase 3-like isoform X2 n=1 Tax=Wasmannia auropunctata TaxID=64793 RepID=UPI0005EEDB7B|nr:PREDICTED: lipase 3-like isoform X2 [Wasmannia auropunctata]